MEIKPSDLGPDRAVALIALRTAAHTNTTGSSPGKRRGRLIRAAMAGSTGTKRRLGPLGRLWTRGLGMDDETAAEAVAAMGATGTGIVAGFGGGSIGLLFPAIALAVESHQPGPALLVGSFWALFAGTGFTLPGVLLRRWYHNSISAGEIDQLIGQADDDVLERAYLTLLRDVLQHENIPEEAARDIRTAIRTLGEALDRLPPVGEAARADVHYLRSGAVSARARALAEPDPVIAGSLERQAEALERSAEAADRSSLLLRRTAALREELAAQTEALRLGLAAFYSGATDVADLSHLSEAVRGVAAEAASVADARAEVDSASTWSAPATPAAQPLRVGAGQ